MRPGIRVQVITFYASTLTSGLATFLGQASPAPSSGSSPTEFCLRLKVSVLLKVLLKLAYFKQKLCGSGQVPLPNTHINRFIIPNHIHYITKFLKVPQKISEIVSSHVFCEIS